MIIGAAFALFVTVGAGISFFVFNGGSKQAVRQGDVAAEHDDWPRIETASPFPESRSLPLPGRVIDAIEGADGRFLFLKSDTAKIISVFDVNALEIVRELPLGNAHDLLAAGRDVLILVDPETGRCRRWSLRTWEQLPEVTLEASLPIASIALGSASNGPLAVVDAGNREKDPYRWPSPFLRFFDIDTFKPVGFNLYLSPDPEGRFAPVNRGQIHASADGRTFSLSNGRTCLRICDDTLIVKRIARGHSPLRPGPDGQMVYGPNVRRFINWQSLTESQDQFRGTWNYPATKPPLFIEFTESDAIVVKYFGENRKVGSVGVMLPGEAAPLFSSLALPVTFYTGKNGLRQPEHRFHFIWQANVFAVVRSEGGHRLELFHLDVAQSLKERGKPYLYFSSSPPIQVRPGARFRYNARCVSSDAGIELELRNAPAGMSVDERGTVAWNVPAEQQAGLIDVELVARSSTGLERSQWFSVFCHAGSGSGPGTQPVVKQLAAVPAQKRSTTKTDITSVAFLDPAEASTPATPVEKLLRTRSNLKNLARAMEEYESRNSGYPRARVIGPDGKTPHSWRVALLPCLGRQDLYDQYRTDEPWDSPANQKVLEQMPDIYRSPYDDPDSTNSGYYAVVGPGSVIEETMTVRRRDIVDGSSATLVCVEAKRNVPWTKPEDIPFDPAGPLPEINGFVDGVLAFATASGQSHVMAEEIIRDHLKTLIIRHDDVEFFNRFLELVIAPSAPVDRPQQPPDDDARTLSNLRTLAAATDAYLDDKNGYPPAVVIGPDGKTPHSWRVELLPYLDRKDLFDQYRLDEPWDSPANRKVLEQMPDVFRSPYDDPRSTNSGYYAVVGPGTIFEPGMKVRPLDILDGISLTLLYVEARRNTPWTKPDDIPFNPSGPVPELGGFVEDRIAFATADRRGKSYLATVGELGDRLNWLILRSDLNRFELPAPPREVVASGRSAAAAETHSAEPSSSADSDRPRLIRRRQPSRNMGTRVLAGLEGQIKQTLDQLTLLAHAMQKYHYHYERFPPAVVIGPDGKTPHSWRVALLPFIDQQELYDQYQRHEPWDSPANKEVLAKMPDVYRSPLDGRASLNSGYFVLVGPGTMFEEEVSVGIARAPDGNRNTLLIVECKREIPWTKPEDIPFDPDKPVPELGGFVNGHFAFAAADLSRHFVRNEQLKDHLKQLIVRNDFQPQSREKPFNLQDTLNPPQPKPEQKPPVLPPPRTKSERSLVNLTTLGWAMIQHHQKFRRFPPAAVIGPDGKTPHSWRVALLPFIDQHELYDQYQRDEPWDSPANKRVLEQIPDVFRSPFDDPQSTNSGYFVLVGPRSLFDGSRGLAFRDIPDGTPTTFLIVESKLAIPWTKPEDIPFDPEGPPPQLGGYQAGKFAAVFADCHAQTLDYAEVADRLKWFIIRDDYRKVNRPGPTR